MIALCDLSSSDIICGAHASLALGDNSREANASVTAGNGDLSVIGRKYGTAFAGGTAVPLVSRGDLKKLSVGSMGDTAAEKSAYLTAKLLCGAVKVKSRVLLGDLRRIGRALLRLRCTGKASLTRHVNNA